MATRIEEDKAEIDQLLRVQNTKRNFEMQQMGVDPTQAQPWASLVIAEELIHIRRALRSLSNSLIRIEQKIR